MMIEEQVYRYNGPVICFGRCIANKWSSETFAVSEKKAKSNLIFQFKKQNGLLPGTIITLPGKLNSERCAYGRV
jgi:hypothetical protein